MNKQPNPKYKRGWSRWSRTGQIEAGLKARRKKKGRRVKSGPWWKDYRKRHRIKGITFFDEYVNIEQHKDVINLITAEDIKEGEAEIARGEFVTIDQMREEIKVLSKVRKELGLE